MDIRAVGWAWRSSMDAGGGLSLSWPHPACWEHRFQFQNLHPVVKGTYVRFCSLYSIQLQYALSLASHHCYFGPFPRVSFCIRFSYKKKTQMTQKASTGHRNSADWSWVWQWRALPDNLWQVSKFLWSLGWAWHTLEDGSEMVDALRSPRMQCGLK